MNHDANNGRNFGDILTEAKEELKQFVETRIDLFKMEMRERLKIVKSVAPLAAVGITFLATAWLLFTLALVGVVVGLLAGNPFRWCFGFLAVAVLWTIVGGVAALSAKRRFHARELVPRRTIDVLKQDRAWLQTEVKSQI